MIKYLSTIIFFCLYTIGMAQINVEQVGVLPEPVANNAVCEGFVDGKPFLFSFGGIDSTKQFDGIHLRSFRYDIQTGEAIQIADLPDSMGKIASAASRIGNVIYISGGYHVFANGAEVSSNKMHRYDIENNVFLPDGTDIPVPIDDHVQAVWRDSLIFMATGWSNTGNVPNVQIYNPNTDEWLVGNAMPNFAPYMSFGASGTILNDTLYFFGGASSEFGFSPQSRLRLGAINPDNPTDITWSIVTPSEPTTGYRTGATIHNDKLYWIGGSFNTYNYNGIAYDGSGGVPLTNRILYTDPNQLLWSEEIFNEVPMDLRGIADISQGIKYIAGGMITNQEVTDRIYKITFDESVHTTEEPKETLGIKISPNPFIENVIIYNDHKKPVTLIISNSIGKLCYTQDIISGDNPIQLGHLTEGIYYFILEGPSGIETKKLIKTKS